MEGLKEIYSAMFRLMKHKGILTQEEYDSLLESMNYISYLPFITAINNVCKDGN